MAELHTEPGLPQEPEPIPGAPDVYAAEPAPSVVVDSTKSRSSYNYFAIAGTALASIGWFIYLGGLGACQNACSSPLVSYPFNLPCSKAFSLSWWGLWFSFVVILFLWFTIVTKSIQEYKHGLMCWLVICAALLTTEMGEVYRDYTQSDRKALFAGQIMITIFFYLLISALGAGYDTLIARFFLP
eukprot:EC123507.1.p1 GENE.EC123507.1~~EC123507.1.p1  ORF type:complete len:185 (+),score=15.21 EC123507.1:74-628(+)